MTDRILDERRQGLEEAFFAQENARLVQRLREEGARGTRRQSIAAAAGIQDDSLLDALEALEISPETLGAFSLVPLVLVAWADGSISAEERAAALRASEEAGVAPGSPARALLESWLGSRPPASLEAAWLGYAHALGQGMDPAARGALRGATLDRARKVAEAAGGFLGLTSPVSESERKVLAKLEAAFT